MNYLILKDKPVRSIKDDILDRENFIKRFAECLEDYISLDYNRHGDSLIVGLQGEWGCGKTSISYMIQEELNKELYCGKYSVKRLETWNGMDKERLLLEFFRTLFSAAVKEKEFDKASVVEIVRDVLYRKAHIVSKGIHLFGGVVGLGAITPDSKTIEQFLFEDTFEDKKRRLSEQLKRLNKTIIYFIDDIDRLSNDEIVLIFQLVKSIADFPNVIYILCYDRDVVCTSLDKIQKKMGEEYIKKVVQVPFDVPEPSRESLCRYCTNRLIVILKLTEDRHNQYTIFVHLLLLQYLKNLRDCNRFFNVLYFNYKLCGQNINLPDLIGITILKMFNKEIYDMIYENKDIFCGNSIKLADVDSVIKDKLEKMDNKCRLVIGIMFPKMTQFIHIDDCDLLRNIFGGQIIHPIRKEESFNLYFQMSVSNTQVEWNDIYQTFNDKNEGNMCKFFSLWQENNQWWDVAEQIRKSMVMPRSDRMLYLSVEQLIKVLKGLSLLESKMCFEERVLRQTDFEFFLEPMFRNVLTSGGKRVDTNTFMNMLNDKEISIGLLAWFFPYLSKGKSWDPWKTNLWGVESEFEIQEQDFLKYSSILESRIDEEISRHTIWGVGAVTTILCYCNIFMKNVLLKYFSDLNDSENKKKEIAFGVLLCIDCFFDGNSKLYWKRDPLRWENISAFEGVDGVFEQYWTEEKMKAESREIELWVNAAKVLFTREYVSIDEIT